MDEFLVIFAVANLPDLTTCADTNNLHMGLRSRRESNHAVVQLD